MKFYYIFCFIIEIWVTEIQTASHTIRTKDPYKTKPESITNMYGMTDEAIIEYTKKYLRSNGYDLVNERIKNSLKQTFESLEAFSEDKEISKTLK